jgi:hypothetical protein
MFTRRLLVDSAFPVTAKAPAIPLAGYIPGASAVERMIAVGELAARRALLPSRDTVEKISRAKTQRRKALPRF